jgi:aspartate/methionine/tyrosine aminotransferase
MDLINKMSTLLVPGDCFEMEGFLRIGYGCKKETLEKGLAFLSEYFRTL